ncbi:MAG TPA: ATP-binding cassette domain-containing protein [Acetobacteraceae bacterium]|nr:ATP-binding cassette domain-containing protein [Acetobacteraceae bacterium]
MDTAPPLPAPIAASEPLIAVQNLCLTLPGPAGPVNILRNISFAVSAGEAIAIVGPSGSGKTSLLMVLAGLERATSGSVHIAGQNLSALSEDQLARFRRTHIGIVFQAFHLIPGMTALENVMVPLELAGRRDALSTARAALASVGLSHRLAQLPATLSGGEQQRAALARALAPQPSLILADEPTGNLDRHSGTTVIDLLFSLHQQTNSTLLLITHDPALATRCQRTLTLEDGRLTTAALAA